MALPAGETHTALTHQRIEAIRQCVDELQRMGRFGGGTYFLKAELTRRAEGNVIGDGVVEQQHLLRHQRHLLTQAGQVNAVDGVAIDTDLTARDMQKVGQQVGKGALAAARRANQRNTLTGSHHEINRGQCIAFGFGVPVADPVKDDVATHFVQRDRAGVALGRFIEQREDMFGCRQAALNRCIEVGQALHGRIHHQRGRNEGGKTTDRGHAFRRLIHGHGNNDGDGKGRCQLGDRCAEGGTDGATHENAAQIIGHAVKAGDFLCFATVDLDDLLVGNSLLNRRGHHDHVVVLGVHQPTQAFAQLAYGNHQHRHDRYGNQHELPVQIQQPGKQTDNGDAVLDDRQQHGGAGRGDAIHIIGDAVDGFGRRVFLKVGVGQTEEVRKHVQPDLVDDLVLHPGHDVGGRETQCTAQKENAHHGKGQPDERTPFAKPEPLVEHGFHQCR